MKKLLLCALIPFICNAGQLTYSTVEVQTLLDKVNSNTFTKAEATNAINEAVSNVYNVAVAPAYASVTTYAENGGATAVTTNYAYIPQNPSSTFVEYSTNMLANVTNFVFTVPGVYMAVHNSGWYLNATTNLLQFGAFLNDTEIHSSVAVRTTNVAWAANASSHYVFRAIENDVFEMRMRSSYNATVTQRMYRVSIFKIGN